MSKTPKKGNKPKIDKAALEASKKAHEQAKNNNEIVCKDESNTKGAS